MLQSTRVPNVGYRFHHFSEVAIEHPSFIHRRARFFNSIVTFMHGTGKKYFKTTFHEGRFMWRLGQFSNS